MDRRLGRLSSNRRRNDWARSQHQPSALPHEGPAFQASYRSKNPDADWKGLADRDLLGACYAGLWSVPRLMARLRREDSSKLPSLDPQHLEFERWQPRIEDWLIDYNGPDEHFDTAQWPHIAADPPLPFFVLFESMQVSKGLRLGPIGSIIIAETFRAAIERTPLAGPSGLSLAERSRTALPRCCQTNPACWMVLRQRPSRRCHSCLISSPARTPSPTPDAGWLVRRRTRYQHHRTIRRTS